MKYPRAYNLRTGESVTADGACLIHRPGDIYVAELGVFVQLHRDRKGVMRNHFERMRNQEQDVKRRLFP